jgi:hypothetical protein
MIPTYDADLFTDGPPIRKLNHLIRPFASLPVSIRRTDTAER